MAPSAEHEERGSSLSRKASIQKCQSAHVEDVVEFTPEQQRKIIRHIDRRLIVMLGFLHTVALIDRGNLGTAAVAGMKEELRLVGTQYVSHQLSIPWRRQFLTFHLEHHCRCLLPAVYRSPTIRSGLDPKDWSYSLSHRGVLHLGCGDGKLCYDRHSSQVNRCLTINSYLLGLSKIGHKWWGFASSLVL